MNDKQINLIKIGVYVLLIFWVLKIAFEGSKGIIKLLPEALDPIIISNVSTSIVFAVLCAAVIGFSFFQLQKKPSQIYSIITIGMMFVIFIAGTVYIISTDHKIPVLRLHKVVGNDLTPELNLTCRGEDETGSKDALIVPGWVRCTPSRSLGGVAGQVRFEYEDNHTESKEVVFDNSTNQLSFYVVRKVNFMYFYFSSVDRKGAYAEYSDGIAAAPYSDFYFVTKSEYEDRIRANWNLLFLLLGAIFVSVPTMMLNFKKLNE